MAASKAKSEKLPILKSNPDWLNKVHNLERSIATLFYSLQKDFRNRLNTQLFYKNRNIAWDFTKLYKI